MKPKDELRIVRVHDNYSLSYIRDSKQVSPSIKSYTLQDMYESLDTLIIQMNPAQKSDIKIVSKHQYKLMLDVVYDCMKMEGYHEKKY